VPARTDTVHSLPVELQPAAGRLALDGEPKPPAHVWACGVLLPPTAAVLGFQSVRPCPVAACTRVRQLRLGLHREELLLLLKLKLRSGNMKQTVQCYAGQRSCSVSAVQQVSSERRWTVIRRTMTASTFLWHARACPLQRKAQIQILGRIGLLRVVLFDNLVWDPCTPSRLNDSGRGKSLISSVRARC
jgi:hypothetical protein